MSVDVIMCFVMPTQTGRLLRVRWAAERQGWLQSGCPLSATGRADVIAPMETWVTSFREPSVIDPLQVWLIRGSSGRKHAPLGSRERRRNVISDVLAEWGEGDSLLAEPSVCHAFGFVYCQDTTAYACFSPKLFAWTDPIKAEPLRRFFQQTSEASRLVNWHHNQVKKKLMIYRKHWASCLSSVSTPNVHKTLLMFCYCWKTQFDNTKRIWNHMSISLFTT